MATETQITSPTITRSGAATLCEAFQQTAGRFADRVALRTLGGEVELTWSEYADRVRAVAAGLAALGIGRGDTVAMMLTNRPEAFIVDTAALHLGATPFSIYNTSSLEQIEYLFGHAEPRVVVAETQFAERILEVRRSLPLLEHVFLVDGDLDGTQALSALEETGKGGFDFDAAWQTVRPDDVAVLIYTSGTTGPPKGVELTHANVIAEWRMAEQVLPISEAGRLLSYLPMAHLADRVVAYHPALFTGSTITCVRDPRDVITSLPEVRPTLWLAVPRIWEKLKAALVVRFDQEPDEHKRAAIQADLEAGVRKVRLELAGQSVPEELAQTCQNADAANFSKLREQLGLNEAQVMLSGAAPIAPEVLEFFAALGLPICEGWSMSESAAGATVNRKDAIRIGTVGPALPGLEVELADDGELLIRGPNVMRGYRNDPEKTAEAIDAAGWLHTGDIGEIDDQGYVRIVDRKKELIINAAGKNMSPANIENKLKAASNLIGPVVAIGDRRAYNTALVVLDREAASAFATARSIADASLAALAEHELVQAEIAAAVELANSQLSRVEQIKKFTILPVDWQPGGDELTPTIKLRRKSIAEKYSADVDAMYAN
jgi:long-subunit acyl-CoA synthetase (AMP-forming)